MGVFDLYEKNAGGVGAEELLLKSDQAKTADDWSRDGRFIVYRVQDLKTALDLWVLPLDGDRKPRPIVQTPFNELQGHFSSDGPLDCLHVERIRPKRGVRPEFPRAGSKWQISTSGGGVQPCWRGDGKALFFVSVVVNWLADQGRQAD